MRIGIFGGSFDPVHVGHLWIGEAAIETFQLEQLRWIPAATSPLKPHGPIASNEDRLQMLRLALSGCSQHVIDDREIKRGDVSYTVDTVRELLDENPGSEIVMVIGSDSLATIQKWHQPKELLRLVTPAVVQRGGDPPIDFSVLKDLVDESRANHIAEHVIKMPVIQIASSDLRDRLSGKRSIRFQTPRSVEAMIAASKLYQ